MLPCQTGQYRGERGSIALPGGAVTQHRRRFSLKGLKVIRLADFRHSDVPSFISHASDESTTLA